jgi:competence protein ComEA
MFRLTRQEQFIIGVVVLLVAAAVIGATLARRPAEPGHRVDVALNTAPGANVEKVDPPPGKATPTIVVHVAGAVAAPGTYELPVGARVEDAVYRAVPTKQADVHALNLAAKLFDGEKIVVPAQGDGTSRAGVEESAGATGAGSSADSLIDLNTATVAELDTLPGIGPARGAGIVEYRREHPFRRIEDVMEVPGIGPGIFERIKNRITVR